MFRGTIAALAVAATLGLISAESSAAKTGSQLLPEQAAKLKSIYGEYRVFRTCTGRFGGLSTHDVVLGISTKNGVRRIGVIWSGAGWDLHDIDAEIKKDSDISNSFPLDWNYSVKGDPKEDFRCNFRLGKDDRIGVEGDEPFFDLKKFGLQENTPVCFETDETYNNWDCLIYSPKDKRFRLWFQQAHAD